MLNLGWMFLVDPKVLANTKLSSLSMFCEKKIINFRGAKFKLKKRFPNIGTLEEFLF